MAEIRPDSEETRRLLADVCDGTGDFDALFARHREELKRSVLLRFDSRMQSRVDASDVVQETQIEALRRLPDYLERRPMPFHLWLRKTAYEQLIMARRRHVGRARRSVDQELRLPNQSSLMLARQLIAADKSPSQQLNEQQLAHRVQDAISKLADSDREILLMRNYEGLSYDEIASILDIESAAARKRNGRALLRLHSLLTKSGLTESQL